MQIRWANVFALGLIVLALIVFLRNAEAVGAFLATMSDIGPGHTAEEKTVGLIAFGIVLVSIFAAMKLFLNNREKKGDDQ